MKHSGKIQGYVISHMEMLHMMLKYPEVVTNIHFVNISTLPLELQAGVSFNFDNERNEGANVEDGAFVHSGMGNVCNLAGLPMWRHHTASQLLIIDDMKLSKISVDKITQFSL
eukprot:12834788-Ditylum_brightwellii.AAC.1